MVIPFSRSVHYFGVPKMQEKLVSNVRNVIGAEVSDNIIEFLRLMGYHFQVIDLPHSIRVCN